MLEHQVLGREFHYSLFVDSQFCKLPFSCKIDEFVLGLNFCILNQDLSMATWTFKHYRLHEGGISYPT